MALTVDFIIRRIKQTITKSMHERAKKLVFDLHSLYSTERYVDDGGVVQNLLPNSFEYNRQKSARGGDSRRGHDSRDANRYFAAGNWVKIKNQTLAIDLSTAPQYLKHYLNRKAPGFGHLQQPTIERTILEIYNEIDTELQKMMVRLPDGSYLLRM